MHRHSVTTFLVAAIVTALAPACGTKPEPAEVTIALREPQSSISAATVLVDYGQAEAKPLLRGGEVSCGVLVPNVTADFSDDGQGRLTIHARAPQGFSAPVDLAVCRMVPNSAGASAESISAKLRVSVLEGTDTAGTALVTQPVGGKAREHREAELAAKHQARTERPGEAAEPAAAANQASAPPAAATTTPPAASSARPPAPPAAKPAPGGALVPGGKEGSVARAPEPERETLPQEQSDSQGRGDVPRRFDTNEDSDMDRAARSYEIVIGVTNRVGALGALQFDVTHHGSSGGFAGAGGGAGCRSLVQAALATFNDKGHGTLTGALVDLDGIPTPGAVASCTFKSREAVNPSDFSIRVTDATDPEAGKLAQNPQMAVLSLTASE